MKKILDRYIAKTIMHATLIITLVFSGVVTLLSMTSELKNLGRGDYGFAEIIIYLLLRMPGQLYGFAPMIMLLGCMLALNSLNTSRELAVMRASGVSSQQLLRSVLTCAMFLIMGMTVIGEVIAPRLDFYAEVRKENVRNADSTIITSNGYWYHINHNFIHVEHAIGRHLIENVTRYEFDAAHRLVKTYFAKTMSFHKDHWRVTDVDETRFAQDQTISQHLPEDAWYIKLNPALLNVSLTEPSEMSLPKLLNIAHYLERNGVQAGHYLYNFWQRIFQPLSALVMIFLAVPFILRVANGANTAQRMLLGVVVGLVFYLLNAFFGQLCIVFQLPIALAASLPLIIFSILGVILSQQLLKRH